MKTMRETMKTVVIAGLLVGLGMTHSAFAGNRPRVFPPGSHPHGRSYAELSAAWWEWVASIPASENPLLDETGENCEVGQSGPFFFLAGVFNASGTATRHCTVPAHKLLFFPIVNDFQANDPGGTATVEQLRAIVDGHIDGATDLACEVDGRPVRHLRRYRVQSEVFALTLADGNVFGAPPGTYAPAVDDGIYLLLKPLSPGRHTIHFHGTVPFYAFTLDITYHLTVVRRNGNDDDDDNEEEEDDDDDDDDHE